MFTAPRFPRAKRKKPPRCLPTEERRSRTRYRHTREDDSALNRKESLAGAPRGKNPEGTVLKRQIQAHLEDTAGVVPDPTTK